VTDAFTPLENAIQALTDEYEKQLAATNEENRLLMAAITRLFQDFPGVKSGSNRLTWEYAQTVKLLHQLRSDALKALSSGETLAIRENPDLGTDVLTLKLPRHGLEVSNHMRTEAMDRFPGLVRNVTESDMRASMAMALSQKFGLDFRP
jgi:hypothetical protein